MTHSVSRRGKYLFLCLLLLAAVVFALQRELAVLDVISLGKEQAINLGVDHDRVFRRLLLGVVLFISVATALVGPISFLGLIIANLSRQLFCTYRHTDLTAGAFLIGAVLLIAGQLLVEQVYTYSIPHQCIHHRGRRHLLFGSAAGPKKVKLTCLYRT